MSNALTTPAQIVSPVVAIGLAIISLLSLIAYFALSAYAPDFRNDTDGGAHALSNSALGFAGLRALLDASGVGTAVDRGMTRHARSAASLIVLTPPPGSDDKTALDDAMNGTYQGPVLIILPKWIPLPDPTAYGRVLKAGMFDRESVAGILRPFAAKTGVAHRYGIRRPQLTAASTDYKIVPPGLQPVDSLQSITGGNWLPLIATSDGGSVVAKYRKGWVYVLADPDLANTHGVHDLSTAAFALSLIDHLRFGKGRVVFDVTLNGFGQSPSLLRAAFAPPFLGATLCAILAAALIGFHAAVRFGTPPPEAPVHSRGKQALVSNAADMIRMLRREPHMATRYAATTRNLVLRALGVKRQVDARESGALFAAREHGRTSSYASLLAEAERLNRRSDLVALAHKFYEWRQEMLHGRK